jgi:DNA-directed RNA polymerase subunit H (RpoH/RPB5)
MDDMRELEVMRGNLSELLEARGDDISYLEEHGSAVDITTYQSTLVALSTDKTVVFFALSAGAVSVLLKAAKAAPGGTAATECWWCKVTKSDPRSNYIKSGDQVFMVILSEPPTVAVLKFFESHDFQIFYKKELLFNPLKHELVPRHRRLGPAEAASILKKYNIDNPNKLPLIPKTDVVARWLGVGSGDIVEIVRTGGNLFYRYCT